MRTSFLVSAALSLLVVASQTACDEEIDMTRPVIERGTLGEEIYWQVHRDLLRTPDRGEEKAAAIESDQWAFIDAIDALLPPGQVAGLESFMLELLPLWDNDLIPDLVRKLAFVYDDVVSDAGVRDAWIRSRELRSSYAHEAAEDDMIARLAEYPRLRDVTLFTADLILDHDGIDAEGRPAPAENDYFRRLLLSLRDNLWQPAEPTDRYRHAAVLGDVLLRSDPRFALPEALPMYAVAVDPRGISEALVFRGGRQSPIFADADGDGLADVDARGAFVDQGGATFVLAPYGEPFETGFIGSGEEFVRDELGRASDREGQPVYDYIDLNATPLGYVVRRTPDLVLRGILTDTFVGLEGLLGALDRSGDVPRFTNDTPLLDLVDALFQVSDSPDLPALLEGASAILRDHADTLATMFVVMDHNAEINDQYGAHMEPNNTFLDDVLPFLYELSLDKGMLDDLLTALRDPMTRRAFDSLVRLNGTYNDAIRPPLDGPYNTSVAGCLEDYAVGTEERYWCIQSADNREIFAGEVDHTLPAGPGNNSLGQRVLHLVHDGAGVPFSMEIVEATLFGQDISDILAIGPMLTIPDVAAAFFDSVAGNFCLEDSVDTQVLLEDDILGPLLQLIQLLGLTEGEDDIRALVTQIVVGLSDDIGVQLDECPTPGQLIRFFNLPSYELELGPLYIRLAYGRCAAGHIFQQHHADALYAAEASGAVDGLYPLLKAFSDRGQTPLLARMIRAVYRHYPEPGIEHLRADGTPDDFLHSGLRRHERALMEIFREGRLIEVVQELVGILQDLELSTGEAPADVLERFIEHLLDPTAGVATRDGQTTSERGDGTPTAMTRFYLLGEAFDRLDERLVGDPEADEAWSRASEELVDLLFDTEEQPDGRGRFVDSGSAALGTVLTDHFARHLRRHLDAGELHQRLAVDYPRAIEDLLTSRGFAAVVELIRDVRSDPEDQALFDDLMLYLTEDHESAVRSGEYLLYSLIAGGLDAIGYPSLGPFWGDLIDPDRRFPVAATADLPLLTHVAMVLREATELDDDDVTLDLLRRGLLPGAGGEAQMTVLGRVIRQVHRSQPGSGEPMTSEDLGHLYRALSEYIRDDHRGLERVIEIIQERAGERPTPEPQRGTRR